MPTNSPHRGTANQPNQDLFLQATQMASDEITERKNAAAKLRREDKNPIDKAQDLLGAAVGGVAKAAFETKDFVTLSEPDQVDKSQLRQTIERRTDELSREHWSNGLVGGVSQFITGILGAGKIMAPLKIAQKGKTLLVAGEVAKGAVAGAVVIDPHEERLSDLIEQFPALQNPITEYLSASPEDTSAEGRLKNALEGIGMDLALVGTFGLAAKALKLFKSGDDVAAKEVVKQLGDMDQSARGSIEGTPIDGPTGVSGTRANVILTDEHGARALAATDGLEPDVIKGEVTQQVSPSGKPQTTVRPTSIEVSETDLTSILKTSDGDMQAINKFGSREAAERSGYSFNRKTSLPWQKLRTTDDVQTFLDNASSTLKDQLDKQKGGAVLTDARVQSLVNQRAAIFNEDPDVAMGMIRQAGDNARTMVADMEAGLLIANKMADETYDVAFKLRNGMLDDWGGDAVVAKEEMRVRLIATLDALGASNSMRSAAGRALRRNRSEFKITPEALEQLKELDADRLAEVLYASGGDLSKMKELANPTLMKKIMDEAQFSLVNSLLWMYPTHVVNFTSNLYMLAARPAEKYIGSLFMGAKGTPVRKQAAKEYAYMLNTLGDAWETSVTAFLKGDSVLTPHTEEFFEAGRVMSAEKVMPWKPIKGAGDVFHNAFASANYRTIVGMPTRTLGWMDEFMKQSRYRAVVQAQASVEGSGKGLTGQQLQDYVQRQLAASFDAQGRGINPAATREAQIATFQQNLLPNTLGSLIQHARSTIQPIGFALPFVKTPTNVIRYSWKMTPALNMAQGEYRRAIMGKDGAEAQAQAIGQMSMGAMGLGIGASLALAGRLTGSGPRDYKLKKELMATGWKPYSIVATNEDGSKTYFPIGRFDPVGTVFGIIADLVDMMALHPDAKEVESAVAATAIAVAQNFQEKSFLMNFNQLIRAMSEPDTNLPKFFGNIAGSTIPGSSALKGYVNQDPYLRDARGFVDNMMKNMPGFSETLPPQRDAFGEPIWRRLGLTTNQAADVVEEEHNRIIETVGKGITAPSHMRNGVDLRDIILDDGTPAFERLQELSMQPTPRSLSLKEALTKLIQSEKYAMLVDGDAGTKGTKLWAFAGIVSKFRQGAYKILLKENPQVRDAVMEKQLLVRSQILNKRDNNSTKSGAQQILDAVGIKQQ